MTELISPDSNFDPAPKNSPGSPEPTQQELRQQELRQQEVIPPQQIPSVKTAVDKIPRQKITSKKTQSSKEKNIQDSRRSGPVEDTAETPWLASDKAGEEYRDIGEIDRETDREADREEDEEGDIEENLLDIEGVAESSRAGKGASDDGFDATTLYLNEIGFIPLLTAEQEVKLARETVLGSRDSKRRMIESNLRLVVAIAKRFQNRGLCLLDMIEEGNIGLMRAVEKYNPELGYRFSTYATWWIKQAIDRALMNHSQTIRFPIHIMKDIQHCARCCDQLRELLGREPSMNEVAELSARPVEQVKKLMALHIKICSADQAVADDSESTLVDQLPCHPENHPDQIVEEQDLQENMAHWVSKLSKRHREVVVRRFGLNGFPDGTLEDVGRDVGITRERVRQLQLEALMKLRRMMERDGFSPDQLED